jgi:DMSO reductase anchor subunit
MKPAFSVLFLTTLIGIGQGLLVALVVGQWVQSIGWAAADPSGSFTGLGAVLALAFLGLGLFASFFHLANPQRAWRSAARWRTSWLSREVLLLPMVMGLAVIYAGVQYFNLRPVLVTFTNGGTLDVGLLVGTVAALAALLLYVVTGMVYACVKFIREWASPWTVVNFTLMGLASGFTVGAVYAAATSAPLAHFYLSGALALTVVALGTRGFQIWHNGRIAPKSSLKTAIGLHHQQIRQISQGFMGTSFNNKEFTAPGGRDAVRGVTVAFLFFAFALPVALMAVGWVQGDPVVLAAAAIIQYFGLLAERWAFFAQGQHVQNLYYQGRA